MRRLLLSIFLLTLSCRPADTARVVRHGDAIQVSTSRIGLPAFGEPCTVPMAAGRLLFDRTLHADPFDLKVTFVYEPPAQLPSDWPAGNWCDSLGQRVQRILNANAVNVESPRQTSDKIAEAIQRELSAAHLTTSSISARFDLPPGWERTRAIAEIARLARKSRPIIFIGLDGADWQLLDDYIARGVMPNLARLVGEGISGYLTTEHPPLSPLVWTTMMTGVSPLEHQILDFVRFNPTTGEKEPITSDERRVPAIWNMASMGGKRVAVFGLWATYPAEPVHGLMVSDRLFTFLYSESTPPPGIIFPPSREVWGREALAASERATDFNALREFLPWLDQQQYEELTHEANPYAKPGSALRRILVQTEVYRRTGTETVARDIPDLTIVYFEGTDTIGHIFAPYAPPKQPEVTQEEYERYHQVPELYFRRIDSILGEFLAAAERQHAMIVLASDHGFQWKEGRPTQFSSAATATAAKWHRNEGIFLAWGEGIRAQAGHSIHGSIRQICATLLSLTQMPRADGVAGPSLTDGESSRVVDYRSHYAPFRSSVRQTTKAAAEEIAKLRALGYIGTGESAAARPAAAGTSTKTAGAYNNEGLILKHDGRIADAVTSFDRALAIDPNLASAAWNLSDLLFDRHQDMARSDALLIKALTNGLPEASRYVIERAIKYQRGGHVDRSLKLLEESVAAKPEDAELRMFRGRYRIERKDCRGALEDFIAAQHLNPNDFVPYTSAGLAEMCLDDRSAAESYFRRSLQLNPNQPMLQRMPR
ncbi:MAG TPA: alkaline phosphatase family protein [Thermoanaerobaculia bacterium]|nr:alkaline phosphatase family protein [Thermoanaerobaculia bacterium]